MDTVEVGEYLKRLRLLHGYTQSELGKKLNVSDKAISRWENGAGMPEISNLVTIADLFGVSVDDILRCNPNALNGVENADGVKTENETTASEPNEPTTDEAVAENRAEESVDDNAAQARADAPVETKRSFTPSAADRLSAIIFSAFLAFGIYAAIFIPTVNLHAGKLISPDITILIFFCVFALLSVAASVLTLFLPRKITTVIKLSLYGAFALFTLITAAVLFLKYGNVDICINGPYRDDNQINGTFAAIISLEFYILLIMTILYLIREFFDNKQFGKIIGYVCIGLAGVIIITAIVVMAVLNDASNIIKAIMGTSTPTNESRLFISIHMLLIGLAALAFAIKEIGIKCGVVITVLLFAVAGVAIGSSFYFCEIVESPYYVSSVARKFVFAATLFAPAVQSIGFCFSGKRCERNAVRIVTIIALLFLIPCFCYTFNAFALNAYISAHGFSAAVFFRVAVFISVVTSYIIRFISTFKKEID